jgi:hypothetical protein
MAVVVASVIPVDNAVSVETQYPFQFNLTDTVDMDLSLVELTLNGVIMTTANGKLATWDTTTVSGGSVIDKLTDVWFESLGYYWSGSGKNIDWIIKYNTVTLQSGSFTTKDNWGPYIDPTFFFLPQTAGFMVGMPQGSFYYHVSDKNDWVRNIDANAYWLLQAPFFHLVADAYYYIGHEVINDEFGSCVVGRVVINDEFGSCVVNGYNLNDEFGSCIVQGYIINDEFGSALAAVVVINDEFGQCIVAKDIINDEFGSSVVWGLNKNNAVIIRPISEETHQKLLAMGVTFS